MAWPGLSPCAICHCCRPTVHAEHSSLILMQSNCQISMHTVQHCHTLLETFAIDDHSIFVFLWLGTENRPTPLGHLGHSRSCGVFHLKEEYRMIGFNKAFIAGLGVGRGDRTPNMNLGQQQQQQQQQANLAHLLQNPQFAHNLRQQAQQVQASQAASNPFSGAPYGYSNVRPLPLAPSTSVCNSALTSASCGEHIELKPTRGVWVRVHHCAVCSTRGLMPCQDR